MCQRKLGFDFQKPPKKHTVGLYKESAARSTPAYRLLEFSHNITVTRNLLCTTKFDPGHLAHCSAHSLFLTPSPSHFRLLCPFSLCPPPIFLSTSFHLFSFTATLNLFTTPDHHFALPPSLLCLFSLHCLLMPFPCHSQTFLCTAFFLVLQLLVRLPQQPLPDSGEGRFLSKFLLLLTAGHKEGVKGAKQQNVFANSRCFKVN